MTDKTNPLLEEYRTPRETVPFDKCRNEHYIPAVDEGIRRWENEVEAIANSPQDAAFENTVVAFERSGSLLKTVSSVFFGVLGAESNDEMMDIAQDISAKLSDCRNNIYLNARLFARIKAVYDCRASLNLTTEDSRLLQDTFDTFADNGAGLVPEEQAHFRRLSADLNRLMLAFDRNALKDKNRYELHITDEKSLAGLPENIREAAAMEAKERNRTGWVFTLSEPSYRPFIKYADSRPLREQIYRARMNVGNCNDETDNRNIIRQIVNIRTEMARMLGYENHAAYTLKDRMIKTPGQVYDLLYRLLEAYRPVAINEYNAIRGFAEGMEKQKIDIMPWDWSYYSEKLKDIRFGVNDEMTRPYFELERATREIFGLATRLYGITFVKNGQIPVYHPEVEAYEVFDADGRYLAVLYTDFFPRRGKQSGAWMNSLRPQYRDGEGVDHRPHVFIVMNFARPTATRPSLLTCDEMRTFMHEFGHALHGILSDVTYESLSGTNVVQDFVELPSQIMENWMEEESFLDLVAEHYLTREKIPSTLVRSLIQSSRFNAGYMCCRQVGFGLLDMAWHTLSAPFDGSVAEFEAQAQAKAAVLPAVSGTLFSSDFGHIFSGGYAAGYYGYKWAEALEADAFSVFKSAGIFDREAAASFRKNILSKGSAESAEALYRRFRGHDPTIDALLIRDGIKK
ncbi:MAG: M3 family metallopeptidase [Tannerella sp.]|jgi:peptidyl-dipeptidase Dcp|nr:M3 family metallopeptidase [Tannerella sp.]